MQEVFISPVGLFVSNVVKDFTYLWHNYSTLGYFIPKPNLQRPIIKNLKNIPLDWSYSFTKIDLNIIIILGLFFFKITKTNTMLSLYNISDGLPPHSSRLFKVTSYHASKLISTSRFPCETESDIDQQPVQMSEMLREGKRILLSGGSMQGYGEARETATLGGIRGFLSPIREHSSALRQHKDCNSTVNSTPRLCLGPFGTSHTTDTAMVFSCSQTGFKEKYDDSKHLSKIVLFKVASLFQMQTSKLPSRIQMLGVYRRCMPAQK